MSVVILIVGAVLILWGADRLTDGASALARRFRVSELVIGLTVVAFGTSLPEFVISLLSTLRGSADLSIGNVVGSNIFNTLVIVGATACVTPIAVSRGTIRKDVPLAVLSAAVLAVLCLDGVFNETPVDRISRGDGLILLFFFAVFMAYTFSIARNPAGGVGEAPAPEASYGRIAFDLLAGAGCLIGGGNLFVDGAVDIALALGVSETVVGLTLVAGGTSLPELATSVVAARKGCSAIAIGNVIGSNLFNVFFVLGLCATLSPMPVSGISMLDFAVLLVSMLLLWGFAATKRTVERWEGGALLAVYAVYLFFLLKNA